MLSFCSLTLYLFMITATMNGLVLGRCAGSPAAVNRIRRSLAFHPHYSYRHNTRYFPTRTTRHALFSTSTSDTIKKSIVLELPKAEDTEDVAAVLASILLEPYYYYDDNDDQNVAAVLPLPPLHGTILLDGDLGAGKTSFSRGFLRAATGVDNLRVTSPTYLLVNVYPILNGRIEIHHMDLYRLSGDPKDLAPLNLPRVFQDCVSLIEWPERLGSTRIPEDRLTVNIRIQSTASDNNDSNEGEDDAVRIMAIQAHGSVWQDRLQKILDEGYLDDLIAL